MKNSHISVSIYSALISVALGFGVDASASGFAVRQGGASGMGNAFAGGAAAVDDVSSQFDNPASLTRIRGSQFAVVIQALQPAVKFSNTGSRTAAGTAQNGSNGGDAGGLKPIPNFYYATDVNSELKFGVGVSSPFGLGTEYSNDWIGRYQATKSQLRTINLNPALAWRASDTVSVGAGLDIQWADAELNKAIDFSSICLGILGGGVCAPLGLAVPGNQAVDGRVKMSANSLGYGFNLGVLFDATPTTRIGAAYRSRIRQNLSGNAAYSNVPAAFATSPAFSNTSASTSVTLPDSLSASAVHKISADTAIMGDITWTHWSLFNELRIRFDNGAADSVTPENWVNSYRMSLGATTRHNDLLTLRTGIAYDQTPVKDEYRTPTIPDQTRKWLALGLDYALAPKSTLNLSYFRQFVKDAAINKPATGAGTITGVYKSKVDALALQYTYTY